MIKVAFAVVLLFFAGSVFSQSFSLEVTVKNQPANLIVLGRIKGDKFTPVDSLRAEKNRARFHIPRNSTPGMYRLVFGKTLYAQIMNESPQQLDFIFNNEDIILETGFDARADQLLVVLSEENRVWFEFLEKEKEFQQKLKELEMEVDFFHEKGMVGPNSGEEVKQSISMYNQLQIERENYIASMAGKNKNLLAARWIGMYREPFRDGNLSRRQRNEVYQQEYFKNLEFSDETLIHSSIYSDKIFNYLTRFNQKDFTRQQREDAYIKAVDMILAHTSENQKVYEFILSYLVEGFEMLKMDNIISYIAAKYSETTCQTDEKTTLERKLESAKMIPGTTVPNFTMKELNGTSVTLPEVQGERILLLFWSGQCPGCKTMIPFIKNWAIQNHTNVVAISLDTSKTDWENAIHQLGIESWINLCDFNEWDGETATAYNIYATPTLFLIDRQRKIIATPVTTNDLAGIKMH